MPIKNGSLQQFRFKDISHGCIGDFVTLLAGSFYLICTAAFALLSFVIGLRMIGLSTKTGETPEFLLGCGLILTAAVGYGLLITAGVMRPSAADPGSAGLAALTMLGKMTHNVGVMCVIGFVVLVFRRRELGLADPLLVNRFLLWGVASRCRLPRSGL